MAKKQNTSEDSSGPASDIPVLLKIGEHYISKGAIHSVARFGKGCKIILNNGGELIVRVNYDKVVDFVK